MATMMTMTTMSSMLSSEGNAGLCLGEQMERGERNLISEAVAAIEAGQAVRSLMLTKAKVLPMLAAVA